MACGTSARSTTTNRGRCAPSSAQRLGHRDVGRTISPGRSRRARSRSGIRSVTSAARSDWLAPNQMYAASAALNSAVPTDQWSPRHDRPGRTISTATPRPDQAATRVPVSREWVAPQMTARRTRPPSSGSPGSRLNTATIRLLQSRRTRTLGDAAGRGDLVGEPGRSGHDHRHQGAGRGDEQLVARSLDVSFDLGYPAEQEDHDAPDRPAEDQADRDVAEFVQQHAQREGTAKAKATR